MGGVSSIQVFISGIVLTLQSPLVRALFQHVLHLFMTSINVTFVVLQNEDTLKTCVNDYLEKLKQQEERYQTLKKYAEEKLAK